MKNGDGLVLAGASDLDVIRNADKELVRLRLAADGRSARVAQRLTDARLKYPTTAAVVPAGLMVVNSQLDRQKMPPPLLPFDIVTLELPQ